MHDDYLLGSKDMPDIPNITIYLRDGEVRFSLYTHELQAHINQIKPFLDHLKSYSTSQQAKAYTLLLGFFDWFDEIDRLLCNLIVILRVINIYDTYKKSSTDTNNPCDYAQLFYFLSRHYEDLYITSELLVFLACINFPFYYLFENDRFKNFLSLLTTKQVFFIVHFNYRELFIQDAQRPLLTYVLERWCFSSKDYVRMASFGETSKKYRFDWEPALLILSHPKVIERLKDPDLCALLDTIPLTHDQVPIDEDTTPPAFTDDSDEKMPPPAPDRVHSDEEIAWMTPFLLPQVVQRNRPLAQRIFDKIWPKIKPKNLTLIIMAAPNMDDLSLRDLAIMDHIQSTLTPEQSKILETRKKELEKHTPPSPTETPSGTPPSSATNSGTSSSSPSPSHASTHSATTRLTDSLPSQLPPLDIQAPPLPRHAFSAKQKCFLAFSILIAILGIAYITLSFTIDPLSSLRVSVRIIPGLILIATSVSMLICLYSHHPVNIAALDLTPTHFDPENPDTAHLILYSSSNLPSPHHIAIPPPLSDNKPEQTETSSNQCGK